MILEFEFDPDKSAANLAKHGIDFVQAQELWGGAGMVKTIPFALEDRFSRTAGLGAKFWTAIYTLRGDRVRLISVRRARTSEVADYERQFDVETGHGHES